MRSSFEQPGSASAPTGQPALSRSSIPAGAVILSERAGGRTLTPAEVQGEKTFHVRQEWEPSADEALFGLGQHQLGLMNVKGYDLDLWQHNATVAIPFLVSSRGYGILWDNTSFTRFGDLRPFEPIPASAAPRQRPASREASQARTSSGPTSSARLRRASTRAIDIEVPGDAKAPNAAIHPALPASGRRQRPLGGLDRPDDDRRPSLPDLLERGDQAVDRRPSRHRPLAPGLAALVRPRPRPARGGPPTPIAARVVQGPGRGDAAPALEDAGEGRLHLALVRGR